MNNQIKYVRNDKGEFVKIVDSVVVTTKFVASAIKDVAQIYADLLVGALSLSIRIGLFIVLWPVIYKAIKIFLIAASEVGGGLGIF